MKLLHCKFKLERNKKLVDTNVYISCDADPKVLAQYIIALIGNGERNDALRASLEDKLKEFFDDRKLNFFLSLYSLTNIDRNDTFH
jgi:RNA-binding protein 26